MRKINRVKLFINDNDKSRIVANDLILELKKYNFKVVKNDNFDLGISIGGDGSFLRMVKSTDFNPNIYYIGINSGTLGFLQEIDIDKCADFVKRLNSNDFQTEKLSVQETKIVSKDKIYYFKSLNEITIREDEFDSIKLDVKVDNELLEHFIGDGLLFSTSTGSTAYNMSFGGSIIYNTLNTISIVPMAPLNNRVYSSLQVPIIIPSNKIISIIPTDKNNLLFKIDGENIEINNVILIETSVNNSFVNCIRMNDFHFIKVVNKKLLGK